MPDGKYDIMTILEQFVLHVDESSVNDSRPFLFYNTENSYPGFAILKFLPGSFSEDFLQLWGVDSVYGKVASNKRFEEYFLSV